MGLREALEWGGYFDSLSDWYSHNIMPVPFNLVLFPGLCLPDCLELFRRLFLSHVQGWIWEADLCWYCCGRDNKQVFLLSFGREEIQKVDAKLVIPFVTTVLCGLGIVVKKIFGCLILDVCKLFYNADVALK